MGLEPEDKIELGRIQEGNQLGRVSGLNENLAAGKSFPEFAQRGRQEILAETMSGPDTDPPLSPALEGIELVSRRFQLGQDPPTPPEKHR